MLPKLPLTTSLSATIDTVVERVDLRWRIPVTAAVATVSVWAVDALNALERIAEATERIAEATEAVQAAQRAHSPAVPLVAVQ